MIYFHRSRKLPPPQCIYKQNKGITSDYDSWFFSKLKNTMYATWRCKNMCRKLCITTVTTKILPAPYNVLGSLKKNPLDIVNISPYHPPGKTIRVSTTERNIIHNMKNRLITL